MLFPKAASVWVKGGLLRDVGQERDPGGESAGWGPGCRSLTGCAQLHPSSPSCPAHKPPTLFPRHLRGTEPCPGCGQEMEKPSRCSASVAAGKLLAGAEMLCSPLLSSLLPSDVGPGAQPAPPGPVAQRLQPGEGTGGAPGPCGLTRAHAELRRQQQSRVTVVAPTGPDASMVPARHSDGDFRDQNRCQRWRGPVLGRTEHLLGAPSWLPAPPRRQDSSRTSAKSQRDAAQET